MTFVLNRNLVKELAREPWAREVIAEGTEAVAAGAKRESPLGTDFVGYQDRFKTRVTQLKGTVGNTDIAAHIVEFGSVNNPAYAPVRRGVSAAGLRFVDVDNRSDI